MDSDRKPDGVSDSSKSNLRNKRKRKLTFSVSQNHGVSKKQRIENHLPLENTNNTNQFSFPTVKFDPTKLTAFGKLMKFSDTKAKQIHQPQTMHSNGTKAVSFEEMLAQLASKHRQCLQDKTTEMENKKRQCNALKLKNKALKKANNDYNKLKTQYNELKKQNDGHKRDMKQQNDKYNELMDKLRVYEGHSPSLNTMSLDQINEFKTKLQYGLNKIEQAKEQLFENKWKCVVCLDRSKNISVDGCGHIALCDQCEARLQRKVCPICQKAYHNVKLKQVNI